MPHSGAPAGVTGESLKKQHKVGMVGTNGKSCSGICRQQQQPFGKIMESNICLQEFPEDWFEGLSSKQVRG